MDATVDLRVQNIRRSCRLFPCKTAIGLDNLFFADVSSLPDEALEGLAGILRACLSRLALPIQILIQLMVQKERQQQDYRHLGFFLQAAHAYVGVFHHGMGPCESWALGLGTQGQFGPARACFQGLGHGGC